VWAEPHPAKASAANATIVIALDRAGLTPA
jgi:hypothetical protein